MSSSNDIDSLSGLATAVLEVENLLSSPHNVNREVFRKLQDLINGLQVACPNHKGVIAARQKWYQLALESFERDLIIPVEEGDVPNMDQVGWNTLPEEHPLIVGPQTIEHFLRRSYLKGNFAIYFPLVISLFERLAKAEALDKGKREYYGVLVNNLKEALIEGRL